MTGTSKSHRVWERRKLPRSRGGRPLTEPKWRAEARKMRASGKTYVEIGKKLKLHHNTIARFFCTDKGEGTYIALAGPDDDSPFIQKHVTRVIRQVFDRDAVRRFIASGGGAKAREALMRRIAA